MPIVSQRAQGVIQRCSSLVGADRGVMIRWLRIAIVLVMFWSGSWAPARQATSDVRRPTRQYRYPNPTGSIGGGVFVSPNICRKSISMVREI